MAQQDEDKRARLLALVEEALKIADELDMWDVGIGLDRARTVLDPVERTDAA